MSVDVDVESERRLLSGERLIAEALQFCRLGSCVPVLSPPCFVGNIS